MKTISRKTELSSSYYQNVEVSLYVTILYRHATLEVDICDSSEAEQEQFNVVSPEGCHDHHFMHDVKDLASV